MMLHPIGAVAEAQATHAKIARLIDQQFWWMLLMIPAAMLVLPLPIFVVGWCWTGWRIRKLRARREALLREATSR